MPDHNMDDGHRGFEYVVKFGTVANPTHAYCGGPYRGDGRVSTQKDLAAC